MTKPKIKIKTKHKPAVRLVGAAKRTAFAKLPVWMVEMCKAVGAACEPREDVARVLERLAGDKLAAEYAPVVAAVKADSKRGA